jgi:hypothetical protein
MKKMLFVVFGLMLNNSSLADENSTETQDAPPSDQLIIRPVTGLRPLYGVPVTSNRPRPTTPRDDSAFADKDSPETPETPNSAVLNVRSPVVLKNGIVPLCT